MTAVRTAIGGARSRLRAVVLGSCVSVLGLAMLAPGAGAALVYARNWWMNDVSIWTARNDGSSPRRLLKGSFPWSSHHPACPRMAVTGPFSRRYCGNGNLSRCRASLWAAIEAAVTRLAAGQGTNPAAWRSSAIAERLVFIPGLIPNTMRWTNRSAFQQAITFIGHR